MRIHNILHSWKYGKKNIPILRPDQARIAPVSNVFFMVPKVFESLKVCCIYNNTLR